MRNLSNFQQVAAWALLFSLVGNSVYAGGWTQEKGNGFYKVSAQGMIADRYYLANGEIKSITTLQDYSFNFYAEYGVTGRLTLIANMPLYKRMVLNRVVGNSSDIVYSDGGIRNGVGDIEAGARFQLFHRGAFTISGSALLGIPTGKDQNKSGLVMGDGEFNQIIALEGGWSFFPSPIYCIGSLGLNNRTKGFSDELRYGFELGYSAGKKAILIGRLKGVRSLKNGDGDLALSDIYANDQEFLAYGAELDLFVKEDLGLSLTFESAAYGRNVLAAPVFSAGVFLRTQ